MRNEVSPCCIKIDNGVAANDSVEREGNSRQRILCRHAAGAAPSAYVNKVNGVENF